METALMPPPENPHTNHHHPLHASTVGTVPSSRSGRSATVSGHYTNNSNSMLSPQPYSHHHHPSPNPTPSPNPNSHSHSTSTRKRQVPTASAGQSENTPVHGQTNGNSTNSHSHADGRDREREKDRDRHKHGQGHTPMSYKDVYTHPAAMAYMNQHPRRTIPKFGPYLLLQTLGEGEFGKVKLGLHGSWGEEVAVKLIRRAGVDGTVRMSKVEREIEVLKTLHHPNIIHLYDVIETDKYIGIIIEYASGGELFDHILAHRYLKEKDACKLFAQLISGVWYIHQKKIVHRDLKLENLLLDRNRNVIITDFGFANRFEHRADDLMQTSCGSPCYAAPELVISEGLYVGSAVDIWSCGVILYAMLAGYLPFDDDPDNPDGDNINLLYKYIINTPLTFPDYVSNDARNLLGIMLVPDPSKRADLRSIMLHTWLEPYRYLFERSVKDLEAVAAEGQRQKRLQYQKNLVRRAQPLASPPGIGVSDTGEKVARSQSTAIVEEGMSTSSNAYDVHGRPVVAKERDQHVPGVASASARRPVASAIVISSSSNSAPAATTGASALVSVPSVVGEASATENEFGVLEGGSGRPGSSRQKGSQSSTKGKEAATVGGTPRTKASKDSAGRKRTTPSSRDGKSSLPPSSSGPPQPQIVPLFDSPAAMSPGNSDTVRSKRNKEMRHTIQVEYTDQEPDEIGAPTHIGDENDDPFLSIATGVPGRDSTIST